MKKLMMALVILLATTISCWAGNSVYIWQVNQDSDGSIYIKQDGTGNSFGISTSSPFLINGDNLTLIIKQIGNNNIATDSNHRSLKGSNMTFDYIATGNSNILRLDLDDVGADGHYYDIDITGSSNIVEIDTNYNDDVQDTHLDLDIRGDSNDFWMNSHGDSHFLYVLISGDSNDVEFYSNRAESKGMVGSSKANVMIGPNVASHGIFADDSGDEGATIDFYIIGNSNRVHTASWGHDNYQVHDVIGNSNILDVHSCCTNSHVRMVQRGDDNWIKTVTVGNDNTFTYYVKGDDNKAYVYIYTDDAYVNLKQTNDNNYAYLYVSGDSIYDYTLSVVQDGNDSCTYSYNRNTQSSDYNTTITGGC